MPIPLVTDVFPQRRIHLIGGLSDVGKTRWLLPTLMDWEGKVNVLGRTSHPVPWAYVAGDRAIDEAEDTMAGLGIDPKHVRIIPGFGKDNKGWNSIVRAAVMLRPVPQLLVIEGFGDLCGERKPEVREFLSNVTAFCQGCVEFPNGLTVIGVVESPKMKPSERYSNPRQRISGVSAWGYHSSTVILIEGLKGDESLELPDRTIWVCPKQAPRRKLEARFDDRGRLIVLP